MDRQRLEYLLDRIVSGQATPEEEQLYNQWCEDQLTKGEDLYEETSIEARVYKTALLKDIKNRVRPEGVKKSRPWIKYAVAASVILAVGSYFLLPGKNREQNDTILAKNDPAEDSIRVYTFTNTAAASRQLLLEDGSLLRIAPQATVKYKKPFGQTDRLIEMNGTVFFEVARGSTKPFTVLSPAISTTALGTAFTVHSVSNEPNHSVKLHHGKVVVKVIAKNAPAIKPCYLSAGQSLDYSAATGLVFHDNPARGNLPGRSIAKNMSKYGSLKGFTASYEQASLQQVFGDIAGHYSIRIAYEGAFEELMPFTGTIKPADPLKKVLDRIGLLYNLSIIEKPDGFVLKKK